MLGDGLAFGQGVSNEQTLASVLGAELDRRGQPNDVLALAVPGLSPAQSVAALAKRRRGEPAVQRFAGAAGRALRIHDAGTIRAWAELMDAMSFGGRRYGEDLAALPEAPGLDSRSHTSALEVARKAAATSQEG